MAEVLLRKKNQLIRDAVIEMLPPDDWTQEKANDFRRRYAMVVGKPINAKLDSFPFVGVKEDGINKELTDDQAQDLWKKITTITRPVMVDPQDKLREQIKTEEAKSEEDKTKLAELRKQLALVQAGSAPYYQGTMTFEMKEERGIVERGNPFYRLQHETFEKLSALVAQSYNYNAPNIEYAADGKTPLHWAQDVHYQKNKPVEVKMRLRFDNKSADIFTEYIQGDDGQREKLLGPHRTIFTAEAARALSEYRQEHEAYLTQLDREIEADKKDYLLYLQSLNGQDLKKPILKHFVVEKQLKYEDGQIVEDPGVRNSRAIVHIFSLMKRWQKLASYLTKQYRQALKDKVKVDINISPAVQTILTLLREFYQVQEKMAFGEYGEALMQKEGDLKIELQKLKEKLSTEDQEVFNLEAGREMERLNKRFQTRKDKEDSELRRLEREKKKMEAQFDVLYKQRDELGGELADLDVGIVEPGDEANVEAEKKRVEAAIKQNDKETEKLDERYTSLEEKIEAENLRKIAKAEKQERISEAYVKAKRQAEEAEQKAIEDARAAEEAEQKADEDARAAEERVDVVQKAPENVVQEVPGAEKQEEPDPRDKAAKAQQPTVPVPPLEKEEVVVQSSEEKKVAENKPEEEQLAAAVDLAKPMNVGQFEIVTEQNKEFVIDKIVSLTDTYLYENETGGKSKLCGTDVKADTVKIVEDGVKNKSIYYSDTDLGFVLVERNMSVKNFFGSEKDEAYAGLENLRFKLGFNAKDKETTSDKIDTSVEKSQVDCLHWLVVDSGSVQVKEIREKRKDDRSIISAGRQLYNASFENDKFLFFQIGCNTEDNIKFYKGCGARIVRIEQVDKEGKKVVQDEEGPNLDDLAFGYGQKDKDYSKNAGVKPSGIDFMKALNSEVVGANVDYSAVPTEFTASVAPRKSMLFDYDSMSDGEMQEIEDAINDYTSDLEKLTEQDIEELENALDYESVGALDAAYNSSSESDGPNAYNSSSESDGPKAYNSSSESDLPAYNSSSESDHPAYNSSSDSDGPKAYSSGSESDQRLAYTSASDREVESEAESDLEDADINYPTEYTKRATYDSSSEFAFSYNSASGLDGTYNSDSDLNSV